MSEELGPLTFGTKEAQVFLGRDIARDRNYSEAVAFSIDKEARKMMDECYARAKEVLEANIDKLHLIAEHLMEKETLEAEEFEALMNNGELPEEVVSGADKGDLEAVVEPESGAESGQDLRPEENTGDSPAGKTTITFNFCPISQCKFL
jgi:cell division protease FtsH